MVVSSGMRDYEVEDYTCPKCHGSGKVGIINRHDCESCGGTGSMRPSSESPGPSPGGGFGGGGGMIGGDGPDGNF